MLFHCLDTEFKRFHLVNAKHFPGRVAISFANRNYVGKSLYGFPKTNKALPIFAAC